MGNRNTERRRALRLRKRRRDWEKENQSSERTFEEVHAEEKRVRKLAHLRGLQTEGRLFSTFNQPSTSLPDWFYGIRKGTRSDDQNGIDAFAITDVGEIPLQIKSSMRGMEKFWEQRPKSECVVLILHPEMIDVDVRAKTIRFVGARRRYLRRMRVANRRSVL